MVGPRDASRPPGSEGAPRADEATVRALLAAQLPALAELPLVPGPTGWDNAHWLVQDGDRPLAVRLPRREIAVPLVANEALVLRRVAARLPLAVPVPVHVGAPVPGVWPWPWGVRPWLPGERADLAYPPADARAHAEALGRFLRALHLPADADAPRNPFRGVPLAARASRTTAVLAGLRSAGRTDPGLVDAVGAAWERGLATAPYTGPPVWLHGDLHPGNQLVLDGALTAVLDWGDTTAGDPATDLATAWWTLPPTVHPVLREAYGGVDDATWDRAAAWAAAIAAFLLHDGPAAADHAIVAMARRTAQRLAATA